MLSGFVNNLRISRRLNVAFGILVFLTLLAGGGALVARYLEDQALTRANRDQRILDLSSELQIELLDARRREKDFFLRYRIQGYDRAYETYIVPHQGHIANSYAILDEMQSVMESNNAPASDITAVAEIEQELAEYEEYFATIIPYYDQRGNSQTGLEGQLLSDLRDLQAELNRVEEPERQLFLLQRDILNYLLNENEIYSQSFTINIASLRSSVLSSETLPDDQKEEILALIDAVRTGFNGLVDANEQIAARTPFLQSTATSVLTLTQALLPQIRTEKQQADEDAERVAQLTSLISVLLVVISLILGGGLAFIITRSITTPLKKLTEVASSFGAGDLKPRVRLRGQDELSGLGRVVDDMADRLQDMVSSLETRVAERTRDLATAIEVGGLVTSLRSQDEMLPKVVEYIRSHFGLYYTQIYLLDEARRFAVLEAGTGKVGLELLERNHRLELSEPSIVAQVVQRGTPVLVSNTESSTVHRKNPLLPDTRYELAIPLSAGGEIFGVLDMQSAIANTFRIDNLPVYQAMASQLASALQGARAYSEAEAAIARAETISKRVTGERWQAYLGSLSQNERVAYQYNLESPRPLEGELVTNGDSKSVWEPIQLHGQKIGAIAVQEDTEREWLPEEVNLVKEVSERVARAVEQYRAFDETQRRANELQTVAEVSAVASHIQRIHDLLQNVVDLTKERFNLYHAHIYLYDPEVNRLVLEAGAGTVGRQMVDKGHSIPFNHDTSLVAQAARTQEAVVVNNVTLTPNFLPNPMLPKTHSEMAVPMVVGNKLIGILDVQAERINRFSPQDILIQKTLADQVAIAIQNARAFQETEAARQETERIFNSTQDMLGSATFGGYFTRLNPAWTRTLGWTEEELKAHPFVDFVHPDDAEKTLREASKLGDGVLTISFENRYRTIDGDYRWISWNAAPDMDAGLIHFVARDVTDQKQAQVEIERRALELQVVADVSAQAATNLELGSLLKTVADLTKERFNLYHAHIYLYDADEETLELAAGAGDVGDKMVERKHSIPLGHPSSIVARAARNRQGVRVNDTSLEPDFLPNPLLAKTRSEMAIPMIVGEDLVGVLDVQSEQINRFTEEDVLIKTTLADQVAIAVENARAFQETEAARQETERIFNASQDMLGTVTFEGQFTRMNPAWERILGYSVEELRSGLFAELMHPDDTEAALAANMRGLSGEIINIEMRVRNRDGEYRWLAWNTTPDMENREMHFIARDITEQKKAQDEIRRRALELQAVADVSAQATANLEIDTLLKSVTDLTKNRFNLYHAHIYLFNSEEQVLELTAGAGTIGDEMVRQRHSIPVEHQTSIVARAARSRQAIRVNDTAKEPDFLPNPLLPRTRSEMAIPMIVGDTLVGILDIQSDQSNHFDEQDVIIQRTLADQIAVAVENARAYEYQRQVAEQLREVDRLKSEFLANMSHELRTPLNSIIGYAEVLLDGIDGELSEEALMDVEDIHGSGKHLLAIINDILDLAKIEAQQMKIDRQNINLVDIAQDVVHTAQILVKEKPVEVKMQVYEDHLPVYADAVRLRQVVLNLVSNAVKFTEQGSVTVEVGMTPQGEALLRVIDTGIGITEEGLKVVFERFSQVDGSATRRAGGTGLGLTITRELVHLHGGEIHAESEPGVGSTFWFTVPIHEVVETKS